MSKIAFYIMNSKGFYVLKKFIEKFGSENIEYIVSSEDKNLKKDYFKEIKELANLNKISFFNRFDNFFEIEKSFCSYKFAIGWRWIIANSSNLIVFHDSLLPKYRGFAPLVNTLINGDNKGGVTALFASDEYDKGDIIAQKSFEIKYPIKIESAIKQIEPLYFELVDEIYNQIKDNNKLQAQKQDEDSATYSLWLDNEDYFIDWSWSADKIKRFVDAVGYPYDNAKAHLNGKIVKFVDVEIAGDVKIENRKRHIGKVIFIKDGYPIIVCKKGLLKLIDIRDEKNNKLMINFRSKFL